MPLVDSLAVVALGATAFVLGDSLTVCFACDTHTTLAACSRAEASTPATWADVRVGHGGLLEPGIRHRQGLWAWARMASDRFGLNHGPAAG
jgi:hypothetical protein